MVHPDLVLEWADAADRAPRGAELTVSVRLRNTGTDEVTVTFGSPYAWVVEADGQQVDVPGWITAVAHAATLLPGEGHRHACRVELRGPRGGAARTPLPVGEHFLECSMQVTVDDASGAPGRTLRAPRRRLLVVDGKQPRTLPPG